MNIFQRGLRVLSVIFVLLVSANTFAQSQKDRALLSLLDTLPETAEEVVIGVYGFNSKIKIADISLSNQSVIVDSDSTGNGWSKIRFKQALVPVWVSAQYVEQNNGFARVVINRLNCRSQPSLNAEKVCSFNLGDTGKVLAIEKGFVKLNAPVKSVFLVKNEELSALPAAQISRNVFYTTSPANNNINQQATAPILLSQPSLELNKDASQSHIIAPGDSISLLVFGEQDLSSENIRVPESGRVSLPLIGEVNVAGKTTKQVEDQIRTILASGYVKNPRLSVSIFSYRPIFIRGAVQSTGAFPYSEGLSIAKALALAGGALNSAKQNGVSVLRDDQVVESGLSLDSQYQISSGDVITIDEEQGVREDESLFIYLHGEVASPGEYRYRKGLTVEKAIALSGGFTARASRRKINITRYIGVGENQEPTTLKKVKLYTTIMPGDVINVRASLF